MSALPGRLLLALLVLALAASASAQRFDSRDRVEAGERSTFRRSDGGVNNAPMPGVFTVVSVDSYSQVVRLRASDGSTGEVFVGSSTYDISKLNPGDRIQVDFLDPDGPGSRLKAGNIWPVK